MSILEGLTVETDGEGEDVVVMIHGWPDTARLWDGQVEALRDDFRCVRLTLPGYDLGRPRRPTSVADMTKIFRVLIERESPGRPVVLMLHDWGCVFGLHFATRHPELVDRVVAMDVGDARGDDIREELSITAKMMVFGYQFWLAIAWRLGGAIGDRMTRFMARLLGAPAGPEEIGSSMNYPYDMMWMGSYGTFDELEIYAPTKPTLFFYGTRKPFQFFSRRWADSIEARDDSSVIAVDGGHWLMRDQVAEVNTAIRDWLVESGEDERSAAG